MNKTHPDHPIQIHITKLGFMGKEHCHKRKSPAVFCDALLTFSVKKTMPHGGFQSGSRAKDLQIASGFH